MPTIGNTKIQEENWKSLIPVELSLSTSSLSSPTMPPSLFKLVPRHAYLHLALQDEIRRLYAFAPCVMAGPRPFKAAAAAAVEEEEIQKADNDVDDYDHTCKAIPICWFMDQLTATPLKWHLFAGVLYDSVTTTQHPIPWKITLSFTCYPTHILLPLDSYVGPTINKNSLLCSVTQSISHIFTNSLKQALFLQYTSNRMALNGINKQMHEQLWSAILRNTYEIYRPIQEQLIPTTTTAATTTMTTTTTHLDKIPIRIIIDSQPMRVRPTPPYQKDMKQYVSLGDYFLETLPTHFFGQDKDQSQDDHFFSLQSQRYPLFHWSISGIQNISPTLPLLYIWQTLCHPDLFLYIIVVSSST